MSHTIDGLALISSTLENLKWWKNNKIPQQTPNDSYKLLLKIIDNLKIGLKNVYRFKRLALMKKLDSDIEELIALDPEANSIDLRIVYKKPANELRTIFADTYNIYTT